MIYWEDRRRKFRGLPVSGVEEQVSYIDFFSKHNKIYIMCDYKISVSLSFRCFIKDFSLNRWNISIGIKRDNIQ